MNRYFHGTMTRLVTGELLLPPVKTGARCCSTVDSSYNHNPGKVYLTTEFVEAEIYAVTSIQKQREDREYHRAYAGRGWVYEVEPIGALVPDSDYADQGRPEGWQEQFVMADVARIVAEYRPNWDVVALRCLRQVIEDQNGISLGESNWPQCKEALAA